MGILFLIAAAYLADRLERPLQMALLYVALGAIVGLFSGDPIGDILISAGFMLMFCLAYFFTLVTVSGQLSLWLLVLIGFPVALFVIPISLNAT